MVKKNELMFIHVSNGAAEKLVRVVRETLNELVLQGYLKLSMSDHMGSFMLKLSTAPHITKSSQVKSTSPRGIQP